LFEKIIILKEELDWFSKVNLFRQAGFYSDGITTPLTITNIEYAETYKRLEKVKKIGLGFIDFYNLENTEMKEFIEETIIDWKRKRTYEGIASILESLKKQKRDPFSNLNNIFQQMLNENPSTFLTIPDNQIAENK
jgi:hypothetical protein